jgi:hypothetical protein
MTHRLDDDSTTRLLQLLLVGMLLLLLGSGSARAQSIDIPAALEPDLKLPPTTAVFQYGHQFQSDVEDSGTKLRRNNAFFGLSHRARLGERTALFMVGNYTLHGYDFGGSSGPTNYYRWNEVHRAVLGGVVGHDVNERWRILGGGLVRSWGESGAQFGDTLTGGLIGGFDYHPSEDFSIGLLVGAFSKLEGGAGILPVPTLKWRFAESWRLNVGMVQVLDPGFGAQLSYQITPELSFGTGFAYQTRQFRLRDRTRVTPTASRPNRTDDNGVGQETELPVFAMIRWQASSSAVIDLMGGVALGGNLRVEDKDGGRIRDDDYDPAGLLGLKAQIFF